MIKVLFVCAGNICRSPMAEAVFRHKVEQAGLSGEILADSAGTENYHVGEQPHNGTRGILRQKGISWDGIRARRFTRQDAEQFDCVVAMDRANLQYMQRLTAGEHQHRLHLLSDFIPACGWSEVPDPWYTGDFEQTYALVDEGCEALLEHLRQAT